VEIGPPIKIQLNVDVHKYYYYLVKTVTEVRYWKAQSQISRLVCFQKQTSSGDNYVSVSFSVL